MTAMALAGCRVLVVEDEAMVAMLVESVLEDEHCSVVGPFGDLDAAMLAAEQETLDLAVLDINLAGEMVFPVAELLAARGVPFLLLSGYGDKALPPNRQHWPICGKPFRLNELVAALNRLLVPA
jgi:DNA-binding response OmpR family regulator